MLFKIVYGYASTASLDEANFERVFGKRTRHF